ncbi:EH domain-binding protein 1-like isoform X2 [Teleopsis dalmanni]|uniref:EH domain-binding protein 1-like isoform X2 n=1 Tax=Teleopsis dalmanni TaxID=139649 RepID=UPI0018CF6819|nr:EH domain-binding protein 1-like isoform X2 [Teleopsis dalmanni]
MGSVWKRLQRVNKRAAKFQFTASYHELRLETTAKWRPSNLAVVWTRRSRRVASAPLPWEPDMMNPLVGHISWPVPDNHAISVTLFKDPRTHELEDKDWTFVIEDITHLGKKRVLASAAINMRKYASVESTQQSFTLTLKPVSRKITSANLELTISCVFLREGKATDEDMQSVVSLMSVNNNCDVAPLDDLEDIPDLENSGDISDHLYDFTQQLEQMTTSLNGCIDLPTPLSDKLYGDGEVDSLKTPSASQMQQYIDRKQEQQSTIVPQELVMTSIAEPEQNENSIKLTPPNQKFGNIVTSTPIASYAEAKAIGNNVASESERKKLNFSGAKLTELSSTVPKSPEAGLSGDSSSNATTVNESVKSTTDTSTETNISTTLNSTKLIVENSRDIESGNTRLETKRAELQPLNLKKSYEPENNKNSTTQNSNNISNNSHSTTNSNSSSTTKPVERIILKENTPGQDLLEWCKEVTKDTPNVKVTNLTTSWRNGMAFCAIIHHFEPELIDMSKLSAHDVVGNCRTAFDAAEALGIPRVIEPRDMSLLAVPDKLAVMTYLHQLRAHFTGKQLHIEQIGPTSDESSYVIGNYKSDNLSSQNLLNLSHLKAQLLHQNSFDDDIFGIDKLQLSPTSKKDVKNLILSGSKSILGKVLSPTKDKNSINASQHSNLGNQTPPPAANEMNTNGDDIDKLSTSNQENISQNSQKQTLQQQVAVPLSPTNLDPNTANRILSRHKEMSEKAKIMMEKLKISSGDKNENDDERQQRLREQARRIILETRTKTTSNGGVHSLESPTSPTKLKRFNFSPERTISPIHNGVENYSVRSGGSSNGSPKLSLSPVKKITPPRDVDNSNNKLSPSHRLSERYNGNNSLQSFNVVIERISPNIEKKGDKLSYIESELEALEREQEAIDKKASSLEEKLRAVMGGNPKTEETEEQLLSQWFTLVNKKNALLRRQMQLNILEQESDLERKYTMLNEELRAAQAVEDWRKTEAQREKERLLLEELVAIVDKRDQLVQHLHNQEIAIEDDHEIARELEQVDISGGKEKCVIQ